MSNPTLLTENFNGSLGAFAGVDPIRYDSGLWIEEATTNYMVNPVGGVGTTGWSNGLNMSITREAVLPGPLPGWLASVVTTGFKVTATANQGATALTAGTTNFPGAGTYAVLQYVWVPTGFSATGLVVRGANYVGSSGVDGAVDLALRDQWQLASGSITPVGSDLNGHSSLSTTSGTMLLGESVWFTCVAAQLAPVTSPAAGSMGTGYAWNGTAHNSASTRAASSASVATAEPVSVACWYTETNGGAKTFAYLSPLGALGTYGDISYAAGDLTISTTRNLVIGPFAAFDRELTATEQANLRSTQNWSMNSVNGSNIILPLSGRRRPR